MARNVSTSGPLKQPDYELIDTVGLQEKAFPAPVRSAFRVYFEDDAYRAMMDHARMTNKVELGGVLVGDVVYDTLGPYLWIVGSIAAEGAKNGNTQITFTHEAWNHINRIRDARYPQHTLVGWYHTHPGFGVFLSEMDGFIQENFFNQPFQVAVVIETKAGEEGCFVWERGKPTALARYWVGLREVALAGGEASPSTRYESRKRLDERTVTSKRVSRGSLATVISLLTLSFLILVVGLSSEKTRMMVLDQREALSAIGGMLEKFNANAAQDRVVMDQKLSAIDQALVKANTDSVRQQATADRQLSTLKEELGRIRNEAAENRVATSKELSAIREALARDHGEVEEQFRLIKETLGLLFFRQIGQGLPGIEDDSVLGPPPDPQGDTGAPVLPERPSEPPLWTEDLMPDGVEDGGSE